MNAAPDTDSSRPAAGPSIGTRLREAREARKLDIDAVAKDLKLDATVVRALENDDSAALPAAIFVQGYLRGYARLVGLPENDLVRDYTAGLGAPPPLTVRRIRTRQRMLRLPSGTALRNLVLVLLLGIMLWLAWPFAMQLLEMRQDGGGETEPGYLELPPPPVQ